MIISVHAKEHLIKTISAVFYLVWFTNDKLVL